MIALVLLALPFLHAGERQWYQPGALAPGAKVVCISGSVRLVVRVPRGPSGNDVWTRGLQASIAATANGAVEFDCGVAGASRRVPPTTRYIVGPHGLGLLRGVNTRGRLERLYGRGERHGCGETWPAIGLRASFAGCGADAAVTRATVAGRRWSSLGGVWIGDSLARMLFEDQTAARVGPTAWTLGGVGRVRPPRLIATLGRDGAVARFTIVPR